MQKIGRELIPRALETGLLPMSHPVGSRKIRQCRNIGQWKIRQWKIRQWKIRQQAENPSVPEYRSVVNPSVENPSVSRKISQ
jgi:hypothetical protein